MASERLGKPATELEAVDGIGREDLWYLDDGLQASEAVEESLIQLRRLS